MQPHCDREHDRQIQENFVLFCSILFLSLLGPCKDVIDFGAFISRWLFQVLETQLSCTTTLQLVSGSRITRATREMWQLSGLATNSIFFCFFFLWPLVGETLFSSVPPINSLVSVSDPRRAFWADTAPPRALYWPHEWLPELQSYKDTVRCASLGAEVPGHRQQQRT